MDDAIRQHLGAGRYREAFEMLVSQLQQKVFSLAFGMVRDAALAEDLAQDIFLKVWKALPSYNGGAAVSTWVYAIARNTCITEINRRKVRSTVPLSDPDVEAAIQNEPALQTNTNTAGAAMDVAVLIEQLPPHYRQVLVMFYLEQKSYDEVAMLLGIPIGTVKTYLFRAKREMIRLNRDLHREGVAV